MPHRLLILANCCHIGLANCARALNIFDNVESHAVYENNVSTRSDIHRSLDQFDFVLTMSHGDAWKPLATASLKERFGDRLLSFPSINFPGLHPDLCLLALPDGKPAPYQHSAGLFRMHQHAVTRDGAKRRFARGDIPRFVDTRHHWDRSVAALQSRDALCDIAIASIVVDACLTRPAMLTFNHPDMGILGEIVHRAATIWFPAASVRNRHAAWLRHDLMDQTVWPVYDTVAEELNLSYRTPQRIQMNSAASSYHISFDDYVDLAYNFYVRHGSRNLRIYAPNALSLLAQK